MIIEKGIGAPDGAPIDRTMVSRRPVLLYPSPISGGGPSSCGPFHYTAISTCRFSPSQDLRAKGDGKLSTSNRASKIDANTEEDHC
jgi:hypothetical protein